MKRVHAMPFGAAVLEDGGVRFRLWAPSVALVALELRRGDIWREHAMHRADGGWHEITLPHAMAGDRYRYRMPDGLRVPDPASRRNPDDVHGPSEVVDPLAHAWTDPRVDKHTPGDAKAVRWRSGRRRRPESTQTDR